MKKIFIPSAILLALIGTQCMRDDLDTGVLNGRINSNWSAPFFKAFLNLEDIDQESEFIEKDENGALRIAFRADTLVEHSPSAYFDVPEDQPKTISFGIVGGGQLGLEFELATFGGARISEVEFSNGFLNYSFPTDLSAGTMVRFTFFNSTINGAPAQFDFVVTPTSHSGSFNISGLNIDFAASGPSKIGYSVEVIFAPGKSTGDPVLFEWNFSELSVESIQGFFGNRSIALPPSSRRLQLAGLNQFSGAIQLYNPVIKLKVWNPLGVSFSFIPVLTTISQGKPRFINLPVITVNGAVAPGAGSEYTEITFNSGNSDISTLFTDLPDEIFIQGTIEVNPGADSTTVNFGDRQNDVVFGIEIELPLDFSAETLVLRQQLRNFTLLGQLPQEVTRIGTRVRSVNGFPFDALIKVFFKNDIGVIVDSLSLPILQAAQVNASGRVLQAFEYEIENEFDEDQVRALTKVTNAEVEVQLSTVNNGQDRVVIFDDYKLEVRLGISAGVGIVLFNNSGDE